MAYLLVRKGDAKLGHPTCVTQIFESDPGSDLQTPSYGEYILIEYPYDPDSEVTTSLVLSSDGKTLSNPWAGKTIAEQKQLHDDSLSIKRAAEYKEERRTQIKQQARYKIEQIGEPWKIEKATETDLLNGNNEAMKAIAIAKKGARDESNSREAELDALTDEMEIRNFNPYGGANATPQDQAKPFYQG
tara:strand:+ start:2712 stop:3275 length:564 start_codon:yes stop_codon:yes gene_type:complete